MRRAVYLISLFTVLFTATAAVAADDIDTYVGGFIKRHNIPGMAIAVVKDGKLVKAAGYGMANLELSVPADKDSLFEIGSISKQFTAEAVMMLVEEGTLALGDPVSKYLPDAPAAWAKITIANLLTHTSGLRDWEAAGILSYRREYSPKEYIDLIAAQPLDFQPGAHWAYTNSSYPLLGLVIERVSGKPFEQFVTERIFRAAAMPTARFRHPEQIVPGRASGYVDVKGELRNGEPLRPGIIAPNGGIMASAIDMAAWDAALFSGRLLKPATVQQMMSMVRLNDNTTGASGMAWFADDFHGHPFALHNGSTLGGYSAVVYHYTKDKLGIAVLCNIDRWNAVNVAAQHIAGLVVPGISVSSLLPQPADEGRSARMLEFLADVAAGKDPDLLAPELKGRISPGFRDWFARHLKAKQNFALVDREDFGIGGTTRVGSQVRWVERYRMDTTAGTVYYRFDLNPEGKVTRFYPEED